MDQISVEAQLSAELCRAWKSFSSSQEERNKTKMIRFNKRLNRNRVVWQKPSKEWKALYSIMERAIIKQPHSPNKQMLLFLLRDNQDTKSPIIIKDLYRYTQSLVLTGR